MKRISELNNTEYKELLNITLLQEFNMYRNWLLMQRPEKILDCSIKYTFYKCVIMDFPDFDFTNVQYEALLKSRQVIKLLFDRYKIGDPYAPGHIWQMAEELANELVKDMFIKKEKSAD